MKQSKPLAFFVFLFVVFTTLFPVLHAALPPGMTQGEFAIWLVKQAGAIRQLPAAATSQDAIDFLRKLGVVPKEGWSEDKEVDDAFLKSFLDDEDASGTTEELLQQIQSAVESAVQGTTEQSNVFPAAGSSGS